MPKKLNRIQKPLKGEINIPPDKSISHRAVMFASLAKGKSIIKNFSDGQDPKSTLEIFSSLGIMTEIKNNEIHITSNGILLHPKKELYCGNSGTTMRLVSGILAGQKFDSILTGDESLSSRPMKRIITPLTLMGAKIESLDYKAPLKIFGSELHSIEYESNIASAQVKSSVILASVNMTDDKPTIYKEPYLSRNHTEIMLKYMGADIKTDKNIITIRKSKLEPINIEICADISSAAFFIVAALIIPDSKIILKNIGLNPTRTGILDIIQKMGGQITLLNKKEICSEEVGDILVEYSELNACEISGEIIPRLIDEIPVIAILATQAKGKTIIKDAQDLRNKESDRIKCIVSELKKLGANIEETPDGMIISGKTELVGNCEVNSYNDHRLAMSLYIAGLICRNEILINGFEWVNISFPKFEQLISEISK